MKWSGVKEFSQEVIKCIAQWGKGLLTVRRCPVSRSLAPELKSLSGRSIS